MFRACVLLLSLVAAEPTLEQLIAGIQTRGGGDQPRPKVWILESPGCAPCANLKHDSENDPGLAEALQDFEVIYRRVSVPTIIVQGGDEILEEYRGTKPLIEFLNKAR